jgi:RES domain-containing protein
MQVWRLVKTRYATAAFDGEGARLFGARWNSVGVRVAYASDSSALAVLEVLVHLVDVAVLPSYSLLSAMVPDETIEVLDPSLLPAGWTASPVPPEVQAIGDAWVRSGRSLALRVPSVVVAGGSNVLVDPEHRDFSKFRMVSVEPFSFDPRLLP